MRLGAMGWRVVAVRRLDAIATLLASAEAFLAHEAGDAIAAVPRALSAQGVFRRTLGAHSKGCVSDQFILVGERSLRHTLQEFLAHHQDERNHQGLANVIPFPDARSHHCVQADWCAQGGQLRHRQEYLHERRPQSHSTGGSGERRRLRKDPPLPRRLPSRLGSVRLSQNSRQLQPPHGAGGGCKPVGLQPHPL
jgi:hypothetical protein